jgi:ribonuclease E
MLENERHDSERNIDDPAEGRSPGIEETPAAAAAAPRSRARRRAAKPTADTAAAATPAAAAPDAAAPAAPEGPPAESASGGGAASAADPAAGAGEAPPARRPARRSRRTAARPAAEPATGDGAAGDGDSGGPAQPKPATASDDTASGKASAGKAGASRAASGKAGASKAGAGKAGAGKAGGGKTRASKARTGKAGGTQPDASQAEASQAGASQAGASQAGADHSTGQASAGGRAGVSQASSVTAPFAAPFAQASAPSEGAAGQPDSAARTAQPAQAEPSAVPAATFQPPQVIFQPPSAPASAPVKPASAKPASAMEAPVKEGEPQGDAAAEHADADAEGGRRRRRRGSRSRTRTAETEPGQDAGQDDGAATGAQAESDGQTQAPAGKSAGQADVAADADGDEAGAGGSRRRRRKRRRGSAADTDQAGPDDPPNTVVHVRPGRTGAEDPGDEVQVVRGSTRLEAKRQRRKEGRDSGRRRPPVITESEFLARREAVDRVMVVRQRGEWTQIAVLEDGVLVEHYVDRGSHQSLVGNVYLGKVQNVLPSMEAAFVDIGKGRNAVLYAGEVNFDASGLEGESKRIESALKSGQSVLVQVTKDPVGHKGARLTSQASLPGRYLVYVPGGSMMGISRKLPDTERARLKQILKQVMPEGAGVIVRTAAEGASEEELAHDVARLSAQWESIERKAKSASPPELLYSEPDLTIRVIRDIFNEDFTKLVVAGDEGWDVVDEYVRYVAPHLSERLEHWESDEDVFAHYRVDEHLARALERKVWLPSGGSLVIDNTEAMTVIDVNTGKFTGQGGNLEETVTRNNLEAAEEIVRQLRLRDVGGIIVIDFIDMVLESNRELVLRRLLECLARDRTKHQVAEVTSLGLVQMTRKRVGAGLLEAFSETCECCNGRGLIIALDGADHAAHTHRGRPEGGSAKNGKTSRDGKAGKDGKWQRQGKADRNDKAAERKAVAQAGNALVSSAVASIAQASLAQPGAASADVAPVDVTTAAMDAGAGAAAGGVSAPGDAAGDVSANNVTAAGVRDVAEGMSGEAQGGGGPDTGQPAAAAAPRATGGRRRRRAATREPGPPDTATGQPGSAAGADGQAPAEASATASV